MTDKETAEISHGAQARSFARPPKPEPGTAEKPLQAEEAEQVIVALAKRAEDGQERLKDCRQDVRDLARRLGGIRYAAEPLFQDFGDRATVSVETCHLRALQEALYPDETVRLRSLKARADETEAVVAAGWRRVKISVLFAWYDMWVGVFVDRKNKTLYVCPLPCLVIKIQRNGGDE